MAAVKLSKVIAPSFAGVHSDIKKHGHTHYWLKGGRGSTKSSFISVEIVLGMMGTLKVSLNSLLNLRISILRISARSWTDLAL